MAKFVKIVLFIGLIAAGTAEPPRSFKRFQNRNRFFGRQEVAPSASPAVTPYPPAGEKPSIPFDLPNQEAAPFPEPTYGPPDQTYGPPDMSNGLPDQTYGPPQPEETLPAQEDFSEQATDEPEAERLVLIHRNPGKSSRFVLRKGQKFQSAALRRPATFSKSGRFQEQQLIARPILLQDGTLVYSF